jgi:hypothetical protein
MLEGRSRLVADATGGRSCGGSLEGGAHSQADHWHVPKRNLLTNLLVLLEAGQLRIPRRLGEAGPLVRDLSSVGCRIGLGVFAWEPRARGSMTIW